MAGASASSATSPLRAAARVVETGKMLQLEPMPALERRWIHLTLRDNPDVATQSIGEEPNRRVVLVPARRSLTGPAIGSDLRGRLTRGRPPAVGARAPRCATARFRRPWAIASASVVGTPNRRSE